MPQIPGFRAAKPRRFRGDGIHESNPGAAPIMQNTVWLLRVSPVLATEVHSCQYSIPDIVEALQGSEQRHSIVVFLGVYLHSLIFPSSPRGRAALASPKL